MKKLIIVFASIFLILIIVYFVLQNIVENKIENLLQEKIEFEEVDVNLWDGKIKITQPTFSKNGKNIQSHNLIASGFSYYQYLVNKKIEIDCLSLQHPHIEIISSENTENPSTKKNSINFKKEVVVKKVSMEDGKFFFQQDSLRELSVENFSINIDSVGVNVSTLKEKIPFRYKDFSIKLFNIDYLLNELQDLAVQHIELSPSEIISTHINLKPKLSREDYVEVIPYEKDLMDLSLEKFQVKDYNLQLNDSENVFNAKKIVLDSIYFTIYRDKTVKDDPREKDLYSKMLRKLKLKLAIDSMKIQRAYIQYEELIQKSRPPGKIFFEDLHANLTNVTNKNLGRKKFPETKISIQSQFMGKSPLNVHWAFQVDNENDVFTIRGEGFHIPKESINSFFVPAFNMKTYGQVNELYFNFKGNAVQASGDLKIDYQDFKVEVLKKGSSQKNGLMSMLANIAVKKNSKKNGETEKQVEAVKRDPAKSFWNYFWKCIEAGLREALIKF